MNEKKIPLYKILRCIEQLPPVKVLVIRNFSGVRWWTDLQAVNENISVECIARHEAPSKLLSAWITDLVIVEAWPRDGNEKPFIESAIELWNSLNVTKQIPLVFLGKDTLISQVHRTLFAFSGPDMSGELRQVAEMFSGIVRETLHLGNRVFLSHSHNDKPFAQKLSQDLESHGVFVWIDEAEIQLGDSLIQKLSEGIDAVDFVAVLLSKASIDSPWVQKEVDIAMNQEIEGRRVKVLPLLLEDCELPGFLKGKLYADFRRADEYSFAFKQILNRVGVAKSPNNEGL